MNEKQSKDWALRFLAATTTAEVDKVIASDSAFAEAGNWRPYGGVDKNWDRVSAQTSNAVGALAELIINSIDAILMRKSGEAGKIAPQDEPKSMTDAVKRFFPGVIEGKIAHLGVQQRTALAEKSVIIGVKRGENARKFPTYTIADFGEGQNADRFPATLVSLGEKNKEGIPFVQGKFNMGSTGCIVFCTQSDIRKRHYKFILSKRTLSDSNGKWGWTLVRTRRVQAGEELPVVEYFRPSGQIPVFTDANIRAFGRTDIGVIDGGTVVKLYEYDIGPRARAVDLGLHDALTTNLLHCALPIRIYDFDAKPTKTGLRKEGIAERTFSGLHVSVDQDTDDSENSDTDSSGGNIDLPRRLVVARADAELGKINIYATGIKKLKDYLLGYRHRLFYTINGQAQSGAGKRVFDQAKLGDLHNHLLVEVDCDAMDKTARSSVFKSDRERMSDTELTRKLRGIVVDELGNDGALREYAAKIRLRRAGEQIQETEMDTKFWNDLIKHSPELRELLGMGSSVPQERPIGGGHREFVGEKFPTFLELKRPVDGVLRLPVNTYRRIECDTDAENQYFGRPSDTGEFVTNLDNNRAVHSANLRNGKLRITVYPAENTQPGERIKASFGMTDSSRAAPLLVEIEIVFEPPEETKSGDSGTTGGTKPNPANALKPPPIHEVKKEDWREHHFDATSGAYCVSSVDGVTIYVNRDNENLLRLLSRESDESRRELAIHRFKLGVGILTFAMHQKFKDKFDVQENGGEWDEHVRLASSAIAAHVVTLILWLGENPK